MILIFFGQLFMLLQWIFDSFLHLYFKAIEFIFLIQFTEHSLIYIWDKITNTHKHLRLEKCRLRTELLIKNHVIMHVRNSIDIVKHSPLNPATRPKINGVHAGKLHKEPQDTSLLPNLTLSLHSQTQQNHLTGNLILIKTDRALNTATHYEVNTNSNTIFCLRNLQDLKLPRKLASNGHNKLTNKRT